MKNNGARHNSMTKLCYAFLNIKINWKLVEKSNAHFWSALKWEPVHKKLTSWSGKVHEVHPFHPEIWVWHYQIIPLSGPTFLSMGKYFFRDFLQWLLWITEFSIIWPFHTTAIPIQILLPDKNVTIILPWYIRKYPWLPCLNLHLLHPLINNKRNLLHNTTILKHYIKIWCNKFNSHNSIDMISMKFFEIKFINTKLLTFFLI